MFSSFSTALSALSAQSTAIDVVGNNLANLNTTGFKTSTVSFQDLVTQSIGAGLGSTQVGFGVGRPVTLRIFTQGAVQVTGGPLDTAIQGDGFLVVKDTAGNSLYTRGGSLQLASDGALITATGQRVQGWIQSNNVLNTAAPTGDIIFPVGSLKQPQATQNFSFDLNLNASAKNGAATGTFSSSIQVYDTLGTAHTVTVTYTKTATANQWTYAIACPDGTVTTTPATGQLTFDANGRLLTPAATDAAPTIKIAGLSNGAADLNIQWSLYNGTTARLTQFDQPSAIAANSQDGSAAAQLNKIAIADGGKVIAEYSNGQQIAVGQLAMAAIRNPQSLLAVGNSNFQLSADSALPAIGVPGTGGRGEIKGGAIENSTVDIAREFTSLIILQRGYEASSKVITTADEISQNTINLKR